VLRWRRDIATRRLRVPSRVLAVQVTLADGSVFPGTGQLNFVDLALQPATGTLSLRAEFRNPQHVLLPGQFVRVRLLGLKRPDAILVPQRAVQRSLGGAFVYVVGDSNRVAARDVVATSWERGGWLTEQGLRAGDRVVVDGVQKVAPGQPAQPLPYRPAVYPGATAQDVADAVAAPIEQQLSGMQGLLYFKSANSSDGVMNLSVYFDISRNPDLAAVDVQNQIARAQSQLPQEVVRNGIVVQ